MHLCKAGLIGDSQCLLSGNMQALKETRYISIPNPSSASFLEECSLPECCPVQIFKKLLKFKKFKDS